MQHTFSPAVSPRLTDVLLRAIFFAGEQLSLLMEREIRLQGTLVERLPLEQLPGLQRGADRAVTAIYLGFSGDCDGHVLLSFSPEKALQLIAILLMLPETDVVELGDMECSVLGEVGNITTASFLNFVADACNLTLHPSPPTVVQDMIGALLSNVVAEMALDTPQALLLHTVLEVDGERVQGDLVLLPSAASCDLLEARLA